MARLGGIIFGSRTDLHVQSVTMTGHIYRDVILEQPVSLFWGVMCAEFLFIDGNARPHRANIVDEWLQSRISHKRVGSRLRKLKKSTKGLGGKGKLTDTLQNCFGIVIRSNVGNLSNMQTEVIAASFHCRSTDKKPCIDNALLDVIHGANTKRPSKKKKLYKQRTPGLPNALSNAVKNHLYGFMRSITSRNMFTLKYPKCQRKF
ncbi:transposable element Tcb1 transposase [Trichonephila clavipes]|nr:transposable element Tcb1 transposase [Trichonephila clavipes]